VVYSLCGGYATNLLIYLQVIKKTCFPWVYSWNRHRLEHPLPIISRTTFTVCIVSRISRTFHNKVCIGYNARSILEVWTVFSYWTLLMLINDNVNKHISDLPLRFSWQTIRVIKNFKKTYLAYSFASFSTAALLSWSISSLEKVFYNFFFWLK
jgi:hypothetical protein